MRMTNYNRDSRFGLKGAEKEASGEPITYLSEQYQYKNVWCILPRNSGLFLNTPIKYRIKQAQYSRLAAVV